MHQIYVSCELSLCDVMSSTYKDGGRSLPLVDCWGLLRIVYSRIHGVDLPMLDKLRAESVREKTLAHRDMLKDLHDTEPHHGAIAAVMTGSLCTHVGIVIDIDGSLYVLETTESSNARTVYLTDFDKEHCDVRFYKYAKS